MVVLHRKDSESACSSLYQQRMVADEPLDTFKDDEKNLLLVEEVSMRKGISMQSVTLRRTNSDNPATTCDEFSRYTGNNNTNNVLSDDSSLGERLKSGQTLLQLSNVLTDKELKYFLLSSLAAASSHEANADPDKGHLYTRMSTISAAQREGKMETALPESLSNFMERILERILSIVDQQLCPSVRETLFGLKGTDDDDNNNNNSNNSNNYDEHSLVCLFQTGRLQFAKREPAINVYRSPFGHIGMHKDNFDLTILVPLSCPEEDFSGGGTAFWHQKFPKEGLDDPAFILRPPAGTVLLFGGQVSHCGLHIRNGTRAVFVCSFSRSPINVKENTM